MTFVQAPTSREQAAIETSQRHSRFYTTSLRYASRLLDLTSDGLRRVPARLRYAPADLVTVPLASLWSRRTLIARNYSLMLDTSLGDPRVWHLTRTSLRNFGRMSIDFLRTRTLPDAEVLARVDVTGADDFHAVLARNRGVIFALPHAGCWDVAAVFAQAYGCRLTVVTEDNWATELVAGSRADRGVTLAPRARSLRLLFRALRRNECVVMLADMANEGVQTIDVPFFGRPAPFPDGPARLSQKTGAPIMVISCMRRPAERYAMVARTPLYADPSLPQEDAVVDLTARMAQGFEDAVRADPDQWYPYHPIWRSLSAR